MDCGSTAGGPMLGNGTCICFECSDKRRLVRAEQLPELLAGKFSARIIRGMQLVMRAVRNPPGSQFAAQELRLELRQHDPPVGAKRYAVRLYPLGGGNRQTIAVFTNRPQAEEIAGFWGSYIHTEVGVIEIEAGEDVDARHLRNEHIAPSPPRRPIPPIRRPPVRPRHIPPLRPFPRRGPVC